MCRYLLLLTRYQFPYQRNNRYFFVYFFPPETSFSTRKSREVHFHLTSSTFRHITIHPPAHQSVLSLLVALVPIRSCIFSTSFGNSSAIRFQCISAFRCCPCPTMFRFCFFVLYYRLIYCTLVNGGLCLCGTST